VCMFSFLLAVHEMKRQWAVWSVFRIWLLGCDALCVPLVCRNLFYLPSNWKQEFSGSSVTMVFA
jgi:hypothetical protein